MEPTNRLKLWIRILNMLFAFAVVFKLWATFSTRHVAESWTYSHGARFKVNGAIITNSSPEPGVWVDSRHHAYRDTTRIDKADILGWLLAGIPIVMINIYSGAYHRGRSAPPARQS